MRRSVIGIALCCLLLALVDTTEPVGARGLEDAPLQGALVAPAAVGQQVPTNDEPAILEFDVLRSGVERLEFLFGRNRGSDKDRVFFKRKEGRLPPAGTALTPMIGTFRRAGAGGQIDRVDAIARVVDSETVEVLVSLDPRGEHEGRYVGSIGFAGDVVRAEPAVITALLQFPDNWAIALLCLLVLTAAIIAVFLASNAGRYGPHLTWASVGKWVRDHPISVGSAAVAVTAVYFNAYDADPDWRWPADALRFVPTAYAAATGALASLLAFGSTQRQG